MGSTAELKGEYDLTRVPMIVQGAVKLGLLESVVVLLFALASRFLSGILEVIICGIILTVGVAAVTLLPGIWTRARTVEGIAGAAGIGLAASGVFLLIDVTLLQNIGTYTNRWYEIGGGSNWWYHPVWWMVGTFLPWLGAWMLANQASRRGEPVPVIAFGMAAAAAVMLGVIGVLAGFPGAHWSLATFGLAFLPGLVLATVLSAMGKRRD
jgi:hypothetical protein